MKYLKVNLVKKLFCFSNQEPTYTTCTSINLEIKAIYLIEYMHYFMIEKDFNSSI